MTSARMPVWMERKLWYRLMWETERTTDLNVFYDKSLHPDLCSLSLKCTFDTYTSSVQGIRTGIYMNIVMKHLTMMHFLLFSSFTPFTSFAF